MSDDIIRLRADIERLSSEIEEFVVLCDSSGSLDHGRLSLLSEQLTECKQKISAIIESRS